ncbi:hypothetical protein DAI22_06g194000 [Oryza sativa Japonica Group]|nr:hypothetical protein DAI22_06g194000 [Oryza sativa Japonica Group]
MEQVAPPPVRYCGVTEDYEQQVDEEPPSPLSPSRVSSPLPLPEQKLSIAYRVELRPRRKNALINNGPRYRFHRPGEKRRKKKKKKNKKKPKQHYTPPPPPPNYEVFPTMEPDDPDWMRQSVMYAEAALEHYNAALVVEGGGGGVVNELVRAIISGVIITCRADYGHVNFIARAAASGGGTLRQEERLFFAEVRNDGEGWIPTCLRSLDDEADRVGGLAAGDDPPVGRWKSRRSPRRRGRTSASAVTARLSIPRTENPTMPDTSYS